MPAYLPQDVRGAAQAALKIMRAMPNHHLAPYWRKVLYDAMKAAHPVNGLRARGWVAIQAAQHVLPLIEHAPLPDNELSPGTRLLPRQMLATAQDVLHGRADPTLAFQEAAQTFEVFANLMGEVAYDPNHFPLNALMAGLAASKAAAEATGWDVFQSMTSFERTRWLSVTNAEDGMHVMDEQFVFNGSDAAAAAAIAFACGSTSTICEPEKLEEFWEWWLTDAIPAAWERAAGSHDTR